MMRKKSFFLLFFFLLGDVSLFAESKKEVSTPKEKESLVDIQAQTKKVLQVAQVAEVTKKKAESKDKKSGDNTSKVSWTNWRKKLGVEYIPYLGYSLGFGIVPRYFAPQNATYSPTFKTSENVGEIDGTVIRPFVSTFLSLSLSTSLEQLGVKGYMKDLSLSVSSGFSAEVSGNMSSTQYGNAVYWNDIGIGLSKQLYKEKVTGISFGLSLSGKIPVSLASQQSTLKTSLGLGLNVSKSFKLFKVALTSLSLSYSFGANFNFFEQDSGLYNPDLAGIPGVNQRYGMSHSIGLGLGIYKGLSLRVGVSIAQGFSFADRYVTNTGSQVFGSEEISPADLASFAINEGNSYGISIGLNYNVLGLFTLSAGYRNFGAQYEWQFDSNNERQWVVRNPFKLQNGSFMVGLSGRL